MAMQDEIDEITSAMADNRYFVEEELRIALTEIISENLYNAEFNPDEVVFTPEQEQEIITGAANAVADFLDEYEG